LKLNEEFYVGGKVKEFTTFIHVLCFATSSKLDEFTGKVWEIYET